jgi:hypothetical protein
MPLFPQADGVLQGALAAACGQLGLQPEPGFLGKALQLWNTFGVRFGAMLVRPGPHTLY